MRALVFISALFAASTPAFAQSPTEAAKRAFDRGLEAFDSGRYAEAAEEFARSLSLKESPTVWYNLALAYYRIDRWDAALRALERYVALEPPRDQRQAKQIEAMSSELKGKLALIEISVRTRDTTIRIDGEEVKDRSFYVLPGQHELEARRPGHRPVTKTVTLAAGTRLKTEMSPEEPEAALPQAQLTAPEQETALVVEEESEPIYTTWWFWTVAGVVVAAGAAVAIGLAAKPGFDGGNHDTTVEALSR